MGNLCVGEGFRHGQVGAREPVVPGHGILVPKGPEKSQEKCGGGNHVSRGAQKELFCRGNVAGETLDLQTANHHSWRGPAKNGEETKVLNIDESEGRETNHSAQLAERKLPAKRAKQGQETAVG